MTLYLLRHGQAGPRDNYDSLSPLGAEQARLLGEYLAASGVRFDAVIAGALTRQQLTAAHVRDGYRAAGLPFPEIETDPHWSEFHLYGVYQAVAPRLVAADPAFAEAYARMQAELANPAAAVHHNWNTCDQTVLHAWVNGLFEIEVETFAQFRARVEAGLAAVCNSGRTGNVAVFTSATPIAVAVARAVALPQARFIPLLEGIYNSALTRLKVVEGEPGLAVFNATPHLAGARLHTLR
jgi:broad specificity phosphatase PhoE